MFFYGPVWINCKFLFQILILFLWFEFPEWSSSLLQEFFFSAFLIWSGFSLAFDMSRVNQRIFRATIWNVLLLRIVFPIYWIFKFFFDSFPASSFNLCFVPCLKLLPLHLCFLLIVWCRNKRSWVLLLEGLFLFTNVEAIFQIIISKVLFPFVIWIELFDLSQIIEIGVNHLLLQF